MDWIFEHYLEIFAIIGAAYSLALMIVKLTPTPADDKALEQVGGILKFIGKIFGLNLTQGIDTKAPSAKKKRQNKNVATVLLCFLTYTFLMLPMSCSTLQGIRGDPRAECVAAQETFAAVVRSLATLRAEGVFNDESVENITILITEGRDILEKWHKDVLDGIPMAETKKSTFQSIITKLTSYNDGGR